MACLSCCVFAAQAPSKVHRASQGGVCSDSSTGCHTEVPHSRLNWQSYSAHVTLQITLAIISYRCRTAEYTGDHTLQMPHCRLNWRSCPADAALQITLAIIPCRCHTADYTGDHTLQMPHGGTKLQIKLAIIPCRCHTAD